MQNDLCRVASDTTGGPGPGGRGGWGLLAGGGVGKLRLVETLLGHGANPNARLTKGPRTYGFGGFRRIAMAGATPFLVAARSADLAIMHVLLAAGADLIGTTGQSSGTGVLLTVGIMIRMYEQIGKEQMMEMHPVLRQFFGEE